LSFVLWYLSLPQCLSALSGIRFLTADYADYADSRNNPFFELFGFKFNLF